MRSRPNRSVMGANCAESSVTSSSRPVVVTVSFESLERFVAKLFSKYEFTRYDRYQMRLLMNLLPLL